MFVGVTGQIGAGKSTAAEILRSFGAAVVDADQIGRRVVEDSPVLLRKLAREFGVDIVTPKGRLDRRLLARRAFADEGSRKLLNALVHPQLLKELGREMKRLVRHYDIVVVDAALLLDWDLDRQMDRVLVITAPEDQRLHRLTARGMSPDDARSRQKVQPPLAEFQARATWVIDNNGSLKELYDKLLEIWEQLREEASRQRRTD